MWPEKSVWGPASVSLLLVLLFSRAEATEARPSSASFQQSLFPPTNETQRQGPSPLIGPDPDLGAPLELPIYQIGKRARKMSAFMPMRGRKDGRDEQLVQFGLGELDPDSPSILRLVAGGGGQRLAGARQFAAALRRAVDNSAVGGELGAGEPIMEAKLRRAFHPMRGKKWAPPAGRELSGPELAYDELELGEV